MTEISRDRTDDLMAMEPTEVMAQYRAGGITRRDASKLFAALGISTALGPAIERGTVLAQSNELTMVIWEGYADPSFAAPFEEAHDATINATPMSSSDDAFARLQAGGGSNFDLVSASNDVSQRLIDAGLVQPIDPSRLTNYPDLYEQFQMPPYITKDGELYGANFAWGPTLMLYNTEQVTEEPTSWSALLDPQYSGRISTWNAPIQIAQYALLLDPKPEDPYVLDDEQLAQVRDILMEQRPLIRTYWNLGDELKQLYASGEVVISDAWPYVGVGLRADDVPVAEVFPEEGVTGWSDSWMLTSGAQNVDLAYAWMDYLISPEGQMGVHNVTNYLLTNKKVVESLDAEVREAFLMENVPATYDSILMWRNVPNYDKWLQIWQEVTAG